MLGGGGEIRLAVKVVKLPPKAIGLQPPGKSCGGLLGRLRSDCEESCGHCGALTCHILWPARCLALPFGPVGWPPEVAGKFLAHNCHLIKYANFLSGFDMLRLVH